MDPNTPQNNPSDSDEELQTLGEPDDSDLDEPATDGEPLTDDELDDLDEIQEPLDDEEPAVGGDVDEDTTEANAFEDDDTPSPLP